MARNLIARTIITTDVTLMLVDTESAEIINRTYTVSGKCSNLETAFRAAVKVADLEPTVKAVSAVNMVQHEQLYAITEADFLAHAKPVTKNANA